MMTKDGGNSLYPDQPDSLPKIMISLHTTRMSIQPRFRAQHQGKTLAQASTFWHSKTLATWLKVWGSHMTDKCTQRVS